MDSGLDWELRLEIVEPCAWTTEASGSAGARAWWWILGIKFRGSFLEARGESWDSEWEWEWEWPAEAEAAEEEEVGVGALLVDGLLPMMASWDSHDRPAPKLGKGSEGQQGVCG